MELKITMEPFGSQPPVQRPPKEFLEQITEDGIRKLIHDHYNLLVQSEIKHLFPLDVHELDKAKKHAADFFIQICGGYPYFNETRGTPVLRKRHRPFKINMHAREVWLQCYQKLLPKLELPEELILAFWNYLDKFSLYMVNSED